MGRIVGVDHLCVSAHVLDAMDVVASHHRNMNHLRRQAGVRTTFRDDLAFFRNDHSVLVDSHLQPYTLRHAGATA